MRCELVVLELDTAGNGGFATRINLPAGLPGEFLALTSPAGGSAAAHVELMPYTDANGYGNVVDADLNNDRSVDFFDLSIFSSRFFTTNPDADLNGDNFVDFFDLSMFQSLFGQPPGPSRIDFPPPGFGDGPQPTGAQAQVVLELLTRLETEGFDFSGFQQHSGEHGLAHEQDLAGMLDQLLTPPMRLDDAAPPDRASQPLVYPDESALLAMSRAAAGLHPEIAH